MHKAHLGVGIAQQQVVKIILRIFSHDQIQLVIARIAVDHLVGKEGSGLAIYQDGMDAFFVGIFGLFCIEAEDIAFPFAQTHDIGAPQVHFFIDGTVLADKAYGLFIAIIFEYGGSGAITGIYPVGDDPGVCLWFVLFFGKMRG